VHDWHANAKPVGHGDRGSHGNRYPVGHPGITDTDRDCHSVSPSNANPNRER